MILLLVFGGIAFWQFQIRRLHELRAALSTEEQRKLLRVGLKAVQAGDFPLARQQFSSLVSINSLPAFSARCALGDLEFRSGQIYAAEQLYLGVLEDDPENAQAHDRLGQLLAVQGRAFEAAPHLVWGLKQVQFSFEQLMIAARPESILNESMRAQIEQWPETGADGARRNLALAVLAINAEQFDASEPLLQSAVDAAPNLIEAQAQLGMRLALRPRDAAFFQWHEKLPVDSRQHPGIQFALGEALRDRGDHVAALGFYLTAIHLNPNHRAAVYQAGQVLAQVGKAGAARRFLDRVRALDELQVSLEILARERDNLEHVTQAARATESLGRVWEAQGWYGYRASLEATPAAMEDLARIRKQIRPDLPQTDPRANPSTVALRREYPPQSVTFEANSTKEIASLPAATTPSITFTNAAEELGVVFQYYNDHDPKQTAMRMQESMGGGVLILDYDLDGWPDIHATQGCQWPPSATNNTHLDHLFRNQQGEHFTKVSGDAQLVESGYSHGGSVGDYNDDGFPDLYIGNAGPNRLFRNNGDGTFTDVTTETGVAGDEWTTSCAIADLNGDGWPDIYAVGYLGGDQVYTLICHDTNQIPRSCKPVVHPPAVDRVYLNRGDGQFEDISDTVVVPTGGRGLGVVVADFDGSGKPNIYIANDSEPNFYFVNQTPVPGQRPSFSEQGMILGLALDQSGRSQASMGVAAGDADGNQRLDLFVTNYYHEGSTLYLQSQPNFFSDATRTAGLYDPTFDMLGFGTQFLDADLDSRLDLVVGNGHEGNYTDLGVPFEMPPQFFMNSGNGKFHEPTRVGLGNYFQGKYLARGLARVDWNRDGKSDFAVSNLDAPLALVRNESKTVGHWIGFRLHGTRSSRDAIGATIEAESMTGAQWQQVIAGDGYHASNDRRLILGLGTADQISKLTIRWPSGLVQVFDKSFQADTDWICVEGREPLQDRSTKKSAL